LGGAAERRGSKVTTSTALKAFQVVIAFAVVMGLLAASGGDSQAATSCTGKHVFPGANLVSVAAGSPSGTTFCIHQGTYSVSQAIPVTDGDRFIGVYQSLPRPIVKTTSARMVFNAAGSNRTLISGLRIEGRWGTSPASPTAAGASRAVTTSPWTTLGSPSTRTRA
jgi:hypothetical protein